MKAIHLQASRQVNRETIRGVEFLVSVSPYFFPERLECDYDSGSGAYVIRFKYLDNEPSVKSSDSDDLVGIDVGQHTGRLLKIKVHVDRHDLDQIKLLVVDRIPKAIARAARHWPNAQANYQIAADAIASHADDLFHCVSGW